MTIPERTAPNFGKALREARESKGWSIADLSKVSYVGPNELARIEAGRRPTETAWNNISKALAD